MTISNPRIEVKEAASAAWFGLPQSAKVPARVSGGQPGAPTKVSDGAASAEPRAARWKRLVRRAVVDLAVVFAVLVAVPVLTVSLFPVDLWWRGMAVENVRQKVRSAEPIRALMVEKDPAITPLEAGRAFAALQPDIPNNPDFPLVDVPHPEATWRTLEIAPSMFPTAKPMSIQGPNSEKILDAAANGFSKEELRYLQKLSRAPVWREFDRVARAKSVDMIAGRLVLPFRATATAMGMPIERFGATKEMAYAAVSRAAYHYAIGQRDSCEIILRSIVSYGFAISDNGTGLIPQLIGRVVVGIGRSGLEHYFVLTRDPRAAAVAATQVAAASVSGPPLGATDPPSARLSHEQMRQELLRRAADPNEVRGVRFTALQELAWSSCTNVRELLFGARPDVSEAFERAKLDLARFPSERAVLDLMHRSPNIDRTYEQIPSPPVSKFMIGAASIAGTVLRNPRLAQCTWFATGGWY